MKLDELDHEPIVGTGDSSLLLHKLLCLFVVIAQFENHETYD
jgi:hypothetical protein